MATIPLRLLDQFGTNQLKVWEGAPGSNGQPVLRAYQDGAGVWTIGFGHTKDVGPGDVCTPEQAEQYLQDDLTPACSAVQSYVSAPLGDNQFAALVSFAFNVGIGAFATSTLVKELNQTPPDYNDVPAQLARWNQITVNGVKQVSKGLVNRRALETTLWLTPDAALKPSQVAAADPVAPILTRSDLRLVPTASTTPNPPPTKVNQTTTGKSSVVAIITGSTGAVIAGANQASQITSALQGAFSAQITSSHIFVLLSGLLSFASIAAMGYVWWHKRSEMKS